MEIIPLHFNVYMVANELSICIKWDESHVDGMEEVLGIFWKGYYGLMNEKWNAFLQTVMNNTRWFV